MIIVTNWCVLMLTFIVLHCLVCFKCETFFITKWILYVFCQVCTLIISYLTSTSSTSMLSSITHGAHFASTTMPHIHMARQNVVVNLPDLAAITTGHAITTFVAWSRNPALLGSTNSLWSASHAIYRVQL